MSRGGPAVALWAAEAPEPEPPNVYEPAAYDGYVR